MWMKNSYTSLPWMTFEVTDTKGTVIVPKEVECTKGGRSVPIIVKTNALPYSDVEVSLKEVDRSEN